ncbi:MAG: hypothetical protein K0S65_4585, partial [Labilithrix sp.]|nr:hypothetical protein [Labilithrix sp.]
MKIHRGRDAVLDALRRFEHERGPNEAAAGRMTERLTEAGVLGSGASPSAERVPERRSVRWKPAAVVLVLAGGVVFGSQQVRTHEPPTPAVPPSSIRERSEHASKPAISAERDRAAVASGPPVLSIDDLPSAAPRVAATSSAAAPAPTTTIAVREGRSHGPEATKAAAETGA